MDPETPSLVIRVIASKVVLVLFWSFKTWAYCIMIVLKDFPPFQSESKEKLDSYLCQIKRSDPTIPLVSNVYLCNWFPLLPSLAFLKLLLLNGRWLCWGKFNLSLSSLSPFPISLSALLGRRWFVSMLNWRSWSTGSSELQRSRPSMSG